MLEEEAQKRKDSKSGRVRLYEDKNTTTTRPPTHTATGADGPKVLDGALVTALARLAMERKGVNAVSDVGGGGGGGEGAGVFTWADVGVTSGLVRGRTHTHTHTHAHARA